MRSISGLAGAVAGLLAWQALVVLGDLPPFILPGPMRVAQALWSIALLIAGHAAVTLAEILTGLVLGAILGGLSAILLAASPLARSGLRPILVLSQAIPVFALAFLLTL